MQKSSILNKQLIAAAFSTAAKTYDQAAVIEQEIGTRLIERLITLNITPQYILDLGSGTGYFTQTIQNIFPTAIIIGLDLAFGMTNFASNKNQLPYCCADAEFLPFANEQFDLIFTNCCLPSISNLPQVFIELQRALKVNGILLFSTFGPDTLNEFALDNAWPDMHIIGDILLQQDFKDPVVDMEYLTFHYKQLKTLCQDLQQTGSFNIDLSQMQNLDMSIRAKFEVIYGIAYKQKLKQYKDQEGNIYIPINEITYINS